MLAPKRAEIWGHWAEHRKDQATLFHMDFVDEFRLNNEKGMKDFRTPLFQIMDWVVISETKSFRRDY